MSKIKQYVSLHRTSRKKMLSIADFNAQFGASLPENKAVESAFHADIQRKRKIAFPVRGNLYDIEAKLGLSARETARPRGPRAIATRHKKKKASSKDCGCKMACACDVSTPLRPTMRRSQMKLQLRQPKRAVSNNDVPPAPRASSTMIETKHMGNKRYHKKPAHKEKERNRPGLKPNHVGKGKGIQRHAVESVEVQPVAAAPATPAYSVIEESESKAHMSFAATPAARAGTNFSVEDAIRFYDKHNPEYLRDNDIEAEVQKWNAVDCAFVNTKLREAYGESPGDHYTLDEVRSYYARVCPSFLQENDLHVVMNSWQSVSKAEVDQNLMSQYNSLPGKDYTWAPDDVKNFYEAVNPQKLAEQTPNEVANNWNKFPREQTIRACIKQYGVAPGESLGVEDDDLKSKYERQFIDSGVVVNAMKVIHFVPEQWDGNFADRCVRLKKSYAEMLSNKEFSGFKSVTGKTLSFKSINRSDVKTMFRAVKAGTGSHFFIRTKN